MKVKSLFAALCVPVLFAACSEEELVNSVPQVSLEDREKIDLVLTAERPSLYEGTTRLGINADNKFLWEKDVDVLGVALVDGATYQTVQNNVYVNYPFSANASGVKSTFSGKSAVAKGTYFFHYPYADHLTRGKMAIDFPSAQTYVVPTKEGDLTSLEQAVKGMKLASPLYDIAGVKYADAATYEKDVDFFNLYSVIKVAINPTLREGGAIPEIKSVTLTAGDEESENFMTKANLNATALPVIAGTETAEQLKTDLTNFYEDIMSGDIYTDDDARGSIVLNVAGKLALANGVQTDLYMLAPKGTYDGLTLKINTTEGVYTKVLDREVVIGQKTVGVNTVIDDDIKNVDCDVNFNLDGTGNVVLPYGFKIPAEYAWTEAVKFLEDHAIAYINKEITFELTADQAIDNLPVFDLDIIGGKTLTLNKPYTITEDNVNQFNANTITLAVAAGNTLTLDAEIINATGFKAVVNNGTLNVNAIQNKAITNNGTMNVADKANLTGNITNNGTLNVAGTVTLTNVTNGTAANPGVAPAKPAAINFAASSVVTATITNNAGAITLTAGTTEKPTTWSATAGTIGADASLVVNTNATVSGILTNNGTINHSGILTATVTNNKDINVFKGAVGPATIDGTGKITVNDITDFAAVMAGAKKYTISGNKVTAVVTNYAEYEKANAIESELTYISLKGDWTYASVAPTDKTKKVFTAPHVGIVGLEILGGTLTLEANLEENLDFSGASTVTGNKVDGVPQSRTITGDITNTAALTIAQGITVNTATSSNPYTATIGGDLTVMAGAAMYFGTATVNEGKVLKVNGEIETAIDASIEAGIFGVETSDDFDNFGTVESLGGTEFTGNGTAADAEVGKVTLPDNQSTGTFKGNPTTIPFS